MPPRDPERRHVKRVAAWNMKVGRGKAAVDGLAGLIADHDPQVILLQEGKNYTVRLRTRFGRRWRVYSGTPFTEAANCPILVRRDIPRGGRWGRGKGAVRNRRPWFYRGKGRMVKHPGRVWRWVRADDAYWLSMHKATESLGFNDRAGQEEADNLEEWFGDHDGPMFAAGDWNNRATDSRQDAPQQIARRVKGRLILPSDVGIDYAIARDLDADAERVGKYGSDHRAVIYHLA